MYFSFQNKWYIVSRDGSGSSLWLRITSLSILAAWSSGMRRFRKDNRNVSLFQLKKKRWKATESIETSEKNITIKEEKKVGKLLNKKKSNEISAFPQTSSAWMIRWMTAMDQSIIRQPSRLFHNRQTSFLFWKSSRPKRSWKIHTKCNCVALALTQTSQLCGNTGLKYKQNKFKRAIPVVFYFPVCRSFGVRSSSNRMNHLNEGSNTDQSPMTPC